MEHRVQKRKGAPKNNDHAFGPGNRCRISIESTTASGKRRPDIDALYIKPVLDGIVQSGVAVDDTTDSVALVVIKQRQGAEDSTRIRVESAPAYIPNDEAWLILAAVDD